MNPSSPVGLLIGSHIPPADIAPLAALAERSGFGELWLTEDLWYTSGIVCAAAALAATSTIPVGLGIQSAVTRHASIQALDFATLAQIYPGRFWPGIGLGLPAWLDQMGIMPKAPLRAVRETVESVHRLLGGETVSLDGAHHLNEITLTHPCTPVPPIYVGAVGPKSIRQTGRIADGLVGSVTSGTAYVEWARRLLDEGAATAPAERRKRIATFALFCHDDDVDAARAALRPTLAFYLTVMQGTDLISIYGIDDELAELAAGGVERVAAEMPDRWLDDLAVVGDGPRCAAQIEALLQAGSDSVILFPAPFERGRELVRQAGSQVIPRVGRGAKDVS
ncbi:LLM class flavin-dependent oxidoreductase [Pseudonocardia hispaniensis]|uniref:LLM class flavin-dependent oxidoreductase n=1 Tax=Pseudonocardia hispaniensis TaxID=904933 RepID=A0ABW1J8L8_9PSEU